MLSALGRGLGRGARGGAKLAGRGAWAATKATGRFGLRSAKGLGGALALSTGFAPALATAAYLFGGRSGRGRGGGSSQSETGLLNTSLLFQIRDEVQQIKGLLVNQQIPESERREREFDEQRRHKELLAAISGLSGGMGGVANAQSGGSLAALLLGLLALTGLSMLPKLLEKVPGIVDGIQSFLDKMGLFLLGMWGAFKLLSLRTKAMKPPPKTRPPRRVTTRSTGSRQTTARGERGRTGAIRPQNQRAWTGSRRTTAQGERGRTPAIRPQNQRAWTGSRQTVVRGERGRGGAIRPQNQRVWRRAGTDSRQTRVMGEGEKRSGVIRPQNTEASSTRNTARRAAIPSRALGMDAGVGRSATEKSAFFTGRTLQKVNVDQVKTLTEAQRLALSQKYNAGVAKDNVLFDRSNGRPFSAKNSAAILKDIKRTRLSRVVGNLGRATTLFGGERMPSSTTPSVKTPTVAPNPWFDVPERGMATNKNMFSRVSQVWRTIAKVIKPPSSSAVSKSTTGTMTYSFDNKGPGMGGNWGSMGRFGPTPTGTGKFGALLKRMGTSMYNGLMKGLNAASGAAKHKWMRALGALGTFVLLICSYAEVTAQYMSGAFGPMASMAAFGTYAGKVAVITAKLAVIIGLFMGLTAVLGLCVAAIAPALIGGTGTGIAIAGIAATITFLLEKMFRSGNVQDINVDPMVVWEQRSKNLINEAAENLSSGSTLSMQLPRIAAAMAIEAGIVAHGALFGRGSPMQKNEDKRRREVATNMGAAYNFAGSDFFKRRGGHSDPQPLGGEGAEFEDTKKLDTIDPELMSPSKWKRNLSLMGRTRKTLKRELNFAIKNKDEVAQQRLRKDLSNQDAAIAAFSQLPRNAAGTSYIVNYQTLINQGQSIITYDKSSSARTNWGHNITISDAATGLYP